MMSSKKIIIQFWFVLRKLPPFNTDKVVSPHVPQWMFIWLPIYFYLLPAWHTIHAGKKFLFAFEIIILHFVVQNFHSRSTFYIKYRSHQPLVLVANFWNFLGIQSVCLPIGSREAWMCTLVLFIMFHTWVRDDHCKMLVDWSSIEEISSNGWDQTKNVYEYMVTSVMLIDRYRGLYCIVV